MKPILIVDDQEDYRDSLVTHLLENGHPVSYTDNGNDALTIATHQIPSLVIADILIPGLDGFSLCRQWKSNQQLKDALFVFYSATFTETRDIEFGLSLGADYYLPKQKDHHFLLEMIREWDFKSEMRNPPTPFKEPLTNEEIILAQYNQGLVKELKLKTIHLDNYRLQLEKDIVAKHKADVELQETCKFFQKILDSISFPALVLEGEGKVIHCNSAWMDLLKKSGLPQRKEWIGKDFTANWDTMVSNNEKGPHQFLTVQVQTMLRSQGVGFEQELSWAFNGKGWFLIRGTPFTIHDDYFCTLTFEDVTRFKHS